MYSLVTPFLLVTGKVVGISNRKKRAKRRLDQATGFSPPTKKMGEDPVLVPDSGGNSTPLSNLDAGDTDDLVFLSNLRKGLDPGSTLLRMLDNKGHYTPPPQDEWDPIALAERANSGLAGKGADFDIEDGVAIEKLINDVRILRPQMSDDVRKVVSALLEVVIAMNHKQSKDINKVILMISEKEKREKEKISEHNKRQEAETERSKHAKAMWEAEFRITLNDISVNIDDSGSVVSDDLKERVCAKYECLSGLLSSKVDVRSLRLRPIPGKNTVPVVITAWDPTIRDDILAKLRSAGVRSGRFYPKQTYEIIKDIREKVGENLSGPQQIMIRPNYDGSRLTIKARKDQSEKWRTLESKPFPLSTEQLKKLKLDNDYVQWNSFNFGKSKQSTPAPVLFSGATPTSLQPHRNPVDTPAPEHN